MIEIANRMRRAWSRETAMSPEKWSPDRPSTDQCAVTACLLLEELGVPVVRGQAFLPDGSVESHYWNEGVDLTRDQFPDGTEVKVRPGPQGRDAYDYVMKNADAVIRLEALRANYRAA